MIYLYEVNDALGAAQDDRAPSADGLGSGSKFMKFLLLGIIALFATAGCSVNTEQGSEVVFPLLGADDELYLKSENPVVLPYMADNQCR